MKRVKLYLSLKNKNRAFKIALKTVFVFFIIAILAPLLANDKPLVCIYKGEWLFPAFSFKNKLMTSSNEILNYNMGKEWKLLETTFTLFPPCAYSPTTIDAENAPLKSPFDKQFMVYKSGDKESLPLKLRHWFGTTQNGNDVLSNLIYGTRIAMGISIFGMLIAGLIGIFLGAVAGYFQNDGMKTGYLQFLLLIVGIFLIWFYSFIVWGNKLAEAFSNGGLWLFIIILGMLYTSYKILAGLSKIGWFIDRKLKTDTKFNLPLDTIISKIIEILNSIPALLLIIAVSAISKPSYSMLIFIIGFLSWTTIARITRAEFLKAKQLDYVTSCKAIGMSNFKIMKNQILPNTLPIIFIQLVFGMAGAVLVEASLSFIGVGVPINSASWGNLLNEGRDHFTSWWLVLFPGLSIFTLIFSYNTIAKQISKKN